jgi:hypothetical protein
MLERLFESLGIKLTTVKVVRQKTQDTSPKTSRPKTPPPVTHSHYEKSKKVGRASPRAKSKT